MNTDQKLELIEKQGKAISDIKNEITAKQSGMTAQGYILSILHSDDMFVYMLFFKLILPTS